MFMTLGFFHSSGFFPMTLGFFPTWGFFPKSIEDFFPLEDFFPWTSLRVFTLWSSLDDPFMTPWLSVTDLNYSRQPSLSEIPAQHLTVQVACWLADSPQSSTLLKCLCLNKAWLLYSLTVQSQTHPLIRPVHLLLKGKSLLPFLFPWWSWVWWVWFTWEGRSI